MLLILEDPDTDLETDRLLGQQRTDDQGFFDEKIVSKMKFVNLVQYHSDVEWVKLEKYSKIFRMLVL